jgi:hypothetical protein
MPDKDDLDEVGRKAAAIVAAEDKYVYFLLATASAAIFFALHLTSSLGFQPSQLLLGLAVASWIGSFVAGCVNRALDISHSKNEFFSHAFRFVRPMAYLEAKEKQLDTTKLPELLEMVDQLAADISTASIRAHEVATRCYRYQIRLLVAGGMFFILWHLNEMWLRTTGQ